MFAILPVFKPVGIRSRAVVDAVEETTGAKVGHAGTLDPLAEGVILIAIGPATRLVPYAQRLTKSYRARFRLGQESDSGDLELECRAVPVPSPICREELQRTAESYVGDILQTPPAYSAVRVRGRRAYALAGSGRQVTLEPRRVTVHSIRLEKFEFPDFEIDVRCGSGTYIRSLGRDIAEKLGTVCVMTSLCRYAIGPFDVDRCATMDEILSGQFCDKLCSPLELFDGWPRYELDDEAFARVAAGGKLSVEVDVGQHREIVAIDRDERLIAVLRPASDGRWRPALNFSKHYTPTQ